jgi:hypothetical protein
MQATTQTEIPATGQTLYMALELSNRKWKLGFSDGSKCRQRTITAGDQAAILAQTAPGN